MCPSSNLHTHAVPGMTSIADHPIGMLKELGFRVTVNCDNRLMSNTSMSKEMNLLVDAFGYGLDDLRWFTVNAMKSAFLPFDERLTLINDVIKPAYAALKAKARTGERTSTPAEVRPLGFVVGRSDRRVVRVPSVRAAAEPSQQIGAGGVPRVVRRQLEPVDLGQGDLGPSSSAKATARFSATTGVGVTAYSWS